MSKLVLLIGLIAILHVHLSHSLTIQVEPKTEECFYENINAGSEVIANYQVTRGGLLDIEVKIFDPSNNNIFTGLHFETKMKGKQNFVAYQSGVYKFCFNNEMSRFTAKVLTFNIGVGSEAKGSEPVKAEHLSPIENSVQKIDRVLQMCISEQRRIRVREQTHRDTAEDTNGRIVWWSVGETVTLLVMSIGQIWYLRRWFNVKQRV
eukprot:TRINITY_DN774_c1_g1_i2.p1 TRINITY_DN774_c1_g1~~TRINITY_DN774_c1_g1_i2.p1  ORF type:complete len:206 (+),score=36.96 TRINITY_DN774_c1_g1_i2:99-716(+)